MVGREVSATEIGKHSQLIKSAQDDMATIDVLVCGQCLTVCHFMQDFEKHKQTPCSKENNNIRECKDTKPKIWAFLLWKATQLHNNKNNNNGTTTPNSWSLYQTWIKMDESVRDTWVMAGRTIQSFSKVGQGGLQEMPVKITKTVVNNNAAANAGAASGANDAAFIRKPLTQTKPQIANVKTTPIGKLPIGKTADDMKNDVKISNVGSASGGNVASSGASSAASTPINQTGKLAKKSPLSSTAGSGVTTTPIQGKVNTLSLQSSKSTVQSRRATRSLPNSEELVQEDVEKIVAKRFNPRRKMHEYLVKWDGRPHDQNTWEPLSHLDQVQHLLEVFEKQLARQKENRAALQAKQGTSSSTNTSPVGGGAAAATKSLENKKSESSTPSSSIITGSGSSGAGVGVGVGGAVVTKNTLLPKTKASPFFKSGSTAAVTVGNAAINFSPPSLTDTKTTDTSAQLRPTRTSKIKAMDQVKQWVSNESPANSADSADNADELNPNSMNSSGGSMISGGIGLKRKFHDSMEDLDDELNASDTPSATAATIEDLEEDLIPSHTVKRMKNGTGVSVESKIVRMNGTNARGNPTSFSGESLPVGPKSAEVILTKEKGVSGVVRKPGFAAGVKANFQKIEAQIRVLSKEESAVMSTGIVRTSKAGGTVAATSSSLTTASSSTETSPITATNTSNVTRQTYLSRLGSGSGLRQTTTSTTPTRSHIQRNSAGTIIQRKILTPGGQRTVQTGASLANRANSQMNSTGRLVISRGGGGGGVGAGASQSTITRSTIGSGGGGKVVTPEQKILQLSKSGDLKVTKKMMTREDAVAQRLGSQRQQQMQRQQQSQIQIQKVQQLAPPNSSRSVSSVSVRKRPDGTYTAHEEAKAAAAAAAAAQSQLCPITGKVLGREEQQPSAQHLQDQMLTAAAAAAEQQQQEQLALQQHETGSDEQTLLLTSDQLLTNEDGSPLLVTGEDGTVYQVAGKNAEGQTVLITQGPDGEQQFAYVATAEGDENQVLSLDNAVAEAVSQLSGEQQNESSPSDGGKQYFVNTTQEDGTTHMVAMTEAEIQQHTALMNEQQIAITEADGNNTTSAGSHVAVAGGTSAAGAAVNQLCIQTGDGSDGQEANIPAEVVQAELPSPGGTRRVVLLLQDGTFMMTEMQDEEFRALNIAA